MAQTKIIFAALVAILSVLSATAQQAAPAACQTATPMTNVNATQFAGYWYEEVRAPGKNVSCVKVKVAVTNNQTTLSINTLYANSLSSVLMTQNETATVNVSAVNTNTGFNVTSNVGPTTTYKILSTDYNKSAVLCGYTNVSDTTTSFGVILTRQREANFTLLLQLQTSAATVLTNFGDKSATNITQANCIESSASTSVPVLATVFAAFYTLFKLVH